MLWVLAAKTQILPNDRLLRPAPVRRQPRNSLASTEQLRREFIVAADAGQALVSAAEEEGQLAVVDPQQLKRGGVQVVDVDPILDDAEAETVDRTDDLPVAPNNKLFPRSIASRNPENRDFGPSCDQSRGTPPRRRGERID
jgi:hypothetical protein